MLLTGYGPDERPVLLAGDLNGTASGQHWPQRDWPACPYPLRLAKGRQQPDGSWTADTSAVDHLIGRWDPATQRRCEGAGFHALPDLAMQQGTPQQQAMRPTVNSPVDRGGELIIDLMLINDTWLHAGGLVPGSYQVHLPPPGRTYPQSWWFDHRLATATL